MTVNAGATVAVMDGAESEDRYRQFDVPFPDDQFPCCDPVGAIEIGARLGLASRSIHMIGRRGNLPPPDFSVNNSRAWRWQVILWWAGETGRLTSPALVEEYKATFGVGPIIRRGPRRPAGVLAREDEHPDMPAVPT